MKKYILTFILMMSYAVNAEIVNKISIEGNQRISEETIKVYGEIELNKNYSDQDVNKILKNLYETDFFEDVAVSLNNGILQINVKENQTINSIIFEGEKAKKIKEALIERMNLQVNGSFVKSKLSQDINLIKNIYGTMGFNFTTVEAKIEKFSENRINLYFFVNKGNKTEISKINFIGDKKIRDRRLRDIIVSEEHKFWKFLTKNTSLNKENVELDKRLLANYYKSLGYYDVQIISSSAEIDKTNKTNLTFNINAGTRYRITKISTNVNQPLEKRMFLPLQKEYSKVIGKYYSPFIVKKLLDELDLLIADNDLQFIEHSVNEVLKDNSIEVKFNIYEGAKETVERINIKGNSVTSESVIRSELLLDEGEPFNKLKLDQSIAKLKSRNLFSTVKKTIKSGSSSDLKEIDITVEEKPTGEISAGAGLGTNGGTFAFDIRENNWLGKGMQISTFLDVSRDTIKGQIGVTDPNYKFSGNSLSYHVSSTTNDKPKSGYENSIISTSIATGFEQYKDIYFRPSLQLTMDDLTVTKDASDSLKKQSGSFTDLTFDYRLRQDKRDRAFKPTDGYVSSFTQSLPVVADAPFIKNSISFSGYNSFGQDVIGAVKFYAASITGLEREDVRISKRIKIPYTRLRGFESGNFGPIDGDEYVGGNYASAVNFEASLPNLLPEATKTDLGMFLDFGNIWGVDYDSSVSEASTVRSTVGANIGWTSPVGPMSFVISQNLNKAKTDRTESFNFRLGTTF
jgi:outer membrane protein insertion porin family